MDTAPRAFMEAVPSATYLGLDNDSNDFGGSTGAYRHAEKLLSGFDARIEIADTQQMDRLPGRFDLIHVDGAQFDDGMVHDIRMAALAAKWILVDGYMHTDVNCDNVTRWLKERNYIWAAILPGAEGELLIKAPH